MRRFRVIAVLSMTAPMQFPMARCLRDPVTGNITPNPNGVPIAFALALSVGFSVYRILRDPIRLPFIALALALRSATAFRLSF